MRFFTKDQVRLAEEKSVELGMSWLRLMENAGSAASRVIRETYETAGKKFAVVCGRGNNGGDGYVVARKLRESGAAVAVIQADGGPLTANAMEMYSRAADYGIRMVNFAGGAEDAVTLLKKADYIVDAIFGTGFHGAAEGYAEEVIRYINLSPGRVISLDLPSGAICDTGGVEGACVKASLTVSFTALKPCHIAMPAAEYCGRVVAVSIGMPAEAVDSIPSVMESIDRTYVQRLLRPRPQEANKGDFGKALAVCGSYGMAGAAGMAAEAALRTGAGLVQLAVPKSIYPILASSIKEAVFYPLEETADGTLSYAAAGRLKTLAEAATALLLGCGWGKSPDLAWLLEDLLLSCRRPMVLDADALNLLSERREAGINAGSRRIDILKQAKAPLILTPHPGEMARLTGLTVAEIQRNRVECARKFAAEYGVTLVLKGAGTVVADPAGRVKVNLTGNPGMATGGSGDMLAGMILSLLAQGLPAGQAAEAGVYLHGLCGDRTAAKLSQRGMLPTDMIKELPLLFQEFETAGD